MNLCWLSTRSSDIIRPHTGSVMLSVRLPYGVRSIELFEVLSMRAVLEDTVYPPADIWLVLDYVSVRSRIGAAVSHLFSSDFELDVTRIADGLGVQSPTYGECGSSPDRGVVLHVVLTDDTLRSNHVREGLPICKPYLEQTADKE